MIKFKFFSFSINQNDIKHTTFKFEDPIFFTSPLIKESNIIFICMTYLKKVGAWDAEFDNSCSREDESSSA